jgi:hypothetical protein
MVNWIAVCSLLAGGIGTFIHTTKHTNNNNRQQLTTTSNQEKNKATPTNNKKQKPSTKRQTTRIVHCALGTCHLPCVLFTLYLCTMHNRQVRRAISRR